MRRDKNDTKWKNVKEKVSKRDKSCRFIKKLSVKEYLLLQKVAPRKLLETLDHAHVFAVSLVPSLCYDERNIVLLNRYSHHNLDNCKHPITGEMITREERDSFWKRIIGETTFLALEEQATSKEEILNE